MIPNMAAKELAFQLPTQRGDRPGDSPRSAVKANCLQPGTLAAMFADVLQPLLGFLPQTLLWHGPVIGVLSRLLPFETVNFGRRHQQAPGPNGPTRNKSGDSWKRGEWWSGGRSGLFRLQTDDGKFDSNFISRERGGRKGGYFPSGWGFIVGPARCGGSAREGKAVFMG